MPTINFRVNLTNLNRYSALPPVSSYDAVDDQRNFRTAYIPNNIIVDRELKHGDTFSAEGLEAMYLKNNFTEGDNKFLDIVSESI